MANKRLLYISVHSVLEYDEIKLFAELGYDVFSLGAYTDPRGHHQLPRPGLEKELPFYRKLAKIADEHPRTELPPALIDPFDIIVVMHSPDVLIQNWERIKHKQVVWRTIGQSLPYIEAQMARLKAEGLKIVRYSPAESNLKDYAGSDALIRFYKDPEEFSNWTGKDKKLINFSQTLKGRRDFCRYDAIMGMADGFPFKVYGSGNEDLAEFNGGGLPYGLMKGMMRDARVFVYGGTWPASYTLAFIEAWMTGTPIVAVGPKTANKVSGNSAETYEVHELIENGRSGFVSDNIPELRKEIKRLLEDDDLAKRISSEGREKAIKLFGKPVIKAKWKEFLGKL